MNERRRSAIRDDGYASRYFVGIEDPSRSFSQCPGVSHVARQWHYHRCRAYSSLLSRSMSITGANAAACRPTAVNKGSCVFA